MGIISQFIVNATSSLPGREFIDDEASAVSESLRLVEEEVGNLLKNRALMYIVGAIFVYKIYNWLFGKLDYVRRNPDVGYILGNQQDKVERANEVRRRRQTGDLPPVYPNGWYRLCEAHELKVEAVMQVHALGMDLALFRSASGNVSLIDAYCPHLGANLAAGGTVQGESLQCPFHGWEFNGEGNCTRIPYATTTKKIPASAKVTAYIVKEINDQILMWFDAEDREPYWEPPTLSEVMDGTWSYRGRTTHHINSHIQEIPENAADVAHLEYLHGPSLLDGIDLQKTQNGLFSFLRHDWTAAWAPCTEEGRKHLSILHLTHKIKCFGKHIPSLDLVVEATQVGPGLVYLTWESLFGKGVFIQSLTPVEPLLQELNHCIYAAWTVPTPIAKIFMLGEAAQVERDVMVWNNKMYRSKPIIIREDDLIAKHRRWYKQFYSENSPRYPFRKDDMSW